MMKCGIRLQKNLLLIKIVGTRVISLKIVHQKIEIVLFLSYL